MKRVRFKSLLLVSNVLQKSRFVDFGPVTIITGNVNTTGKSSVLKSLYYTLGANVIFEDEWNPLQVKTLLRFSINENDYTALRDGDWISVFDSQDNVLVSTDSITKELSPFISELFDFELPLVLSQSGDQRQATPAFLYLPFYVDQDYGWTSYFASFTGLQMFTRWQDTFKNFHTGIRPKEFYELTNKIKTENDKIQDLHNEKLILNRTKERVVQSLVNPNFDFDINIEDFRSKLNGLIEQHTNFRRLEDDIRKATYQQAEEKYEIELQISNLEEQIKSNAIELANTKDAGSIICPKCGSIHQSKLYLEYALVVDISDADNFLEELKAERNRVDKELKKIRQKFNEAAQASEAVQKEINSVQSDITLHDALQSVARVHAEQVFEQEIIENQCVQDQIVVSVKRLENEKKALTDRKRTKRIKQLFTEHLSTFFHDLSVDSSNLSVYKAKFTPPQGKLKTGSRGPRQMLALYYAFLNTVYTYSTTARFPIVVDSPKQQEQDSINSDTIVKFCINHLPKGAQLVLATLNYRPNRRDVLVHEFNEKKGLLIDKDYAKHATEILKLTEKAIIYLTVMKIEDTTRKHRE